MTDKTLMMKPLDPDRGYSTGAGLSSHSASRAVITAKHTLNSIPPAVVEQHVVKAFKSAGVALSSRAAHPVSQPVPQPEKQPEAPPKADALVSAAIAKTPAFVMQPAQTDLLQRLSENIRRIIDGLSGTNVHLSAHPLVQGMANFDFVMMSVRQLTHGTGLAIAGQSVLRKSVFKFRFGHDESSQAPQVSVESSIYEPTLIASGDKPSIGRAVREIEMAFHGSILVPPRHGPLAQRAFQMFLEEAVGAFAASKTFDHLQLRPLDLRFAPVNAAGPTTTG